MHECVHWSKIRGSQNVEFVLFKNPLRDENVKAVVLERALTPVDTDKDGRISMSEFLEDWHQRVSQSTSEKSREFAQAWSKNDDFGAK